MFLFNKGHGPARPESKQDFGDLHEADFISTPPWSQDSFPEKLSPVSSRHERVNSGKRNSLLALRARSDTTTSSSSSSFMSRASTMAGTEDSSRRTSQEIRTLNGSFVSLSDAFDQRTRSSSLFSRGKLRRNSKFGAEDTESHDMPKRLSVLRRDGSKKSRSNLRSRISSPFDFQHLTHTEREQFTAMQDQGELAAEYFAARNSQVATRRLTGIKADDLQPKSSSGNLYASPLPEAAVYSSTTSPPRLSPQRSWDNVAADSSPSPTHSRKGSLRQSRSVDSFSQPKIRTSSRSSITLSPPPRVSSRAALGRIEDEVAEQDPVVQDSAPPRFVSKRSSGIWQSPFLTQRPSIGGLEPISSEEEDYFTHAVTTIGDAAVPTLSPTFALENVPEEPESYFNPRPAPQPPIRHTPIFQEPFSPHGRRSSAGSRSGLGRHGTIRALEPVSPKSRRDSQLSPTLGEPFSPRSRRSSPPKVASLRRQSILQEFEASWEDDIDYCYDHAAEADCDYDWDRNSFEFDEPRGITRNNSTFSARSNLSAPAQRGESPIEKEDALRTQFFSGAFRPSLLVPEDALPDLPDLAPRSALSTSTVDPVLHTPLDVSDAAPAIHTPSMPYYEGDGFDFHPPLLSPQDPKFHAIRDDIYDDLLADYQSSEKHYPILDATHSIAGSSLSGATRLSKRSSYDSSIRSGTGSLYSSIRRSASSSGSLPDLVHSRRSTKRAVEESVEFLADQLTFAHLDGDEDEDEEMAHPGGEGTPTNESDNSLSSERTFFAAEDDDKTSAAPSVCEGDEPEREPIRRAPTPLRASSALSASAAEIESDLDISTLPPLPKSPTPQSHHERAASDGAAKLLSFGATADFAAQKPTRQRSSSQSQSRRPPRRSSGYTLSLFPPPPKPRSPSIPTLPTVQS